jgi:hypothetical protein
MLATDPIRQYGMPQCTTTDPIERGSLRFRVALESGGWLVSDQFKLEIEVEAVQE